MHTKYIRYLQSNECNSEGFSDFIKCTRYTCMIIPAVNFKTRSYLGDRSIGEIDKNLLLDG